MKYVSGGELLVDCLREHGVHHIFSIIGGQMGTIYDTVGRRTDIDIIAVSYTHLTVPPTA